MFAYKVKRAHSCLNIILVLDQFQSMAQGVSANYGAGGGGGGLINISNK